MMRAISVKRALWWAALAVGSAGGGLGATAGAEDGPQLQAELRAAEQDAARANARLALVQARRAALAEKWAEAIAEANRALSLLRPLPSDDAVTDQMLMAEGILARAARQRESARVAGEFVPGTPAQHMQPATPAAPPGSTTDLPPRGDLAPTAPQARAERAPARAPGDRARTDQERAAADEVRFQRQQDQIDDVQTDEVNALVDADDARRIPNDWVTYPPDWSEKSRRRQAAYPGGMVARTSSWLDGAGQEWYIGVYDTHDLTYVVPDFVPTVVMNPIDALRIGEDRAALRWQSFIFRGWPEDLAAGIPLLRYFGGVDDLVYRGPKYSDERQRQLEELIRMVTGERGAQAQVTSLPALQPRP